MPVLNLKPTHKIVTHYYKALAESGQLSLLHEGAVAPYFAALLRSCAAPFGWSLQEQYHLARKGQNPLRPDGVLVDSFGLRHGVWEAKDDDDDLHKEARAKFRAGYPADNILFQSPARALLYQDGNVIFDDDITDPERLVEALRLFFGYEPPAFEQWERAVAEFKTQVPELARNLLDLIDKERKENKRFAAAFDEFAEVARQAINPNISTQAVEEMLIQHLLTERIFRNVFNNPDFAQRNVIAREIEKVIVALTSRSFSRHDFLGRLDRFYVAIETTAATLSHYREKQTFLNTVYEQFFQGFSVKVADTHGIVYTPQAVVDFMVRSVDDILRREFGKGDGLASDGVAILDPFVGTGNFILRVMREMPRTRLEKKYREELFCNEVMLLPYYIACMNIEHEYYDLTGGYEPFEGIALVDTFELAEKDAPQQKFRLFVPENTERVERQRKAPIFVIIGNPPYNAGQVNENDNSKNRKYPAIDGRVSHTYAADSRATNRSMLSDPYVKAFRWASDRIGDEGIVAFISNNGFLDGIAFDGMRAHLASDFTKIYHLDLKGNARTSGERRRREAGNIFSDAIRVGVGITILIKTGEKTRPTEIHVHRIPDYLSAKEKTEYLELAKDYTNLEWQMIRPDKRHTWLTEGMRSDYEGFLPMGSKEAKAGNADAIFANYGRGVATTRDTWAYNFDSERLSANMRGTIDFYNEHVHRRQRLPGKIDADSFVAYDEQRISWSRDLKLDLQRGHLAEFEEKKIRLSLYRPFTQKYLFFDRIMNEEVYQFPRFFPNQQTEAENRVISLHGLGMTKPFHAIMVNRIPEVQFTPNGQCFPFYTYDEDGTNRRENITDWALARFREAYGITNEEDAFDSSFDTRHSPLDKWDIFHYIYSLLHHPVYRETYAANLRRELPRIPFVRDFWAYARAGARLAEIHVGYEQQPEYPLTRIENPDEPLDWRVEKMRLSKDRTQIRYNDFLTLGGIPPAAFDYRLGNRSALEWVIDQYRVSTDKRSGITNDPNRADDPQYIVRLIGQVVAVSLETAAIVAGLPEWAVLGES